MAYLSPPGQIINIGTHRMHLYLLGQGAPVVVIDAVREMVEIVRGTVRS